MKDNQLQVNSSGVWIKTSEENVELWRGFLKDTMKYHGFKLLASTPTKDSYYLSYKHHSLHSFDSCESLIVNIFKNGHFRIETKNIDQLFESIIPHFEAKLNMKFDWARGWEKYTYSPHVLQYLNGRDQFMHSHPWWHKRRAEVVEEVKKRDEEDEASHAKIQVDLEGTKRKLSCAKEELASVSTAHEKIQGELVEAKRKISCAKEELQSVNATHTQVEEELDETNKKVSAAKDELTSVNDALSQMSVDVNTFNESRKENLQCCFDNHFDYSGPFSGPYPGHYSGPYHPNHYHHPSYQSYHPQFSRQHSWVPDGQGSWKRRAFYEC